MISTVKCVKGSGFRVQGSRLRVQSSRLRVQGSGLALRFRVKCVSECMDGVGSQESLIYIRYLNGLLRVQNVTFILKDCKKFLSLEKGSLLLFN
jgi:hypothetical protein